MLLAIDIGNTNITFGIFSGAKLIKRFDTPTKVIHRGSPPPNPHRTTSKPASEFNSDAGLEVVRVWRRRGGLNLPYGMFHRIKIDDAIICSVVPKTCKIVEEDLEKLLGKRPYIIGKDISVPIKNLYRKPKQVGSDRLVNAYAGIKLYGSPLIVVDFGTAVTFDVISKNKEYLGGMILPGLQISLDALAEKTALLPQIKLSPPRELIGRDTKNSMLSGIVYGFAALTDDLVIGIKKKIGKEAKVIGTGGNINLIGKYCKTLDKIDKDLTLKGLNLIISSSKPAPPPNPHRRR